MAGLFDVFTTKAAEKGAAAAKAGIDAGVTKYGTLAEQGRDELKTNYAQALMPYTGLQDTSQDAFRLAGDITGAGGAEGNARARASFMTDPAYEFRRDAALDAVERKGLSAGMGASGNTLMALQDRGAQLGGEAYDSWAARAMQMAGFAPTIAAGVSGVYGRQGDQLLGSYTGEGQVGYGAEVAKGQAQKDADLDANRASGQFWNTALGVANLAGKASGFGGFAPGAPRVA